MEDSAGGAGEVAEVVVAGEVVVGVGTAASSAGSRGTFQGSALRVVEVEEGDKGVTGARGEAGGGGGSS